MPPSSKQPHVLIADGDPESRAALMWCLLAHGFCSVDPVSNGLDAGVSLENPGPPDLAIIDLGLPGLDGRTLIEGMLASERLKTVPIIAIGATAPFAPLPPGVLFLEKPVRLVELVAALRVLGVEGLQDLDTSEPSRVPARPSDLVPRLSSRSDA
jgi:DNA-binding response OmpR family regulator